MSENDPREAAARAGRTTFQGAPCRRGHDGERYTRDSKCVHCVRERVRARDARFRELLEQAREG